MSFSRFIAFASLSTLLLCGEVSAAPNQNETSRAKGKALVDKMECANCHIIGGRGGAVAPPLDGISAYSDKAYLVKKLSQKKPLAKEPYPVPEQLMSHINVSVPEADQIADYLLSLPKKSLAMTSHKPLTDESLPAGSQFVPLKKSASSEKGAALFHKDGCVACHAIGPVGGHIGPNLAGVGARRSRMFIENRILHGAIILPPAGEPGGKTTMPATAISNEQLRQLTDFLLTLPPSKKLK